MRKVLWSVRGYTLVEMLVASLILLGSFGIIIPFLIWQIRAVKLATSISSLIAGKATLALYVKNKEAWENTFNNNVTLTCGYVKANVGGAFAIRDGLDRVVYDPVTSPNNGFDYNFVPCNTFNSILGNDNCPFRMNITWEAVCTTCQPPMVRVRGQTVYKPSTSIGLNNSQMLDFSLLKTIDRTPTDAIKDLVTGDDFSCELLNDSTTRCWGVNDDGQLGDGTFANRASPVSVVGLGGTVINMSGGDSTSASTCAVLVGGNVQCWGANDVGQLGRGMTGADDPVPGNVVGLAGPVVSVSGSLSKCAVLSDGRLNCWGENSEGQLGDGTFSDRSSPAPMAGGDIVSVAHTCGYNTCYVTTAGQLKCTGNNTTGMLGIAPGPPVNSPVPVPGAPFNARAVDCSDAGPGAVGYAVASTGQLYAWGSNSYGMLGRGFVGGMDSVPTVVPGLANVTLVDSQYGNVSAVTSNGDVYCWGKNDHGQAGLGFASPESAVPTKINLPGPAKKAISGNGFHCALLEDNRVFCWGDNSQGQLGDGTTTTSFVPVEAKAIYKCDP